MSGYPLLTGIRGQPAADLEKLTQLLQITAHLLEAFPEIVELDLNPVFAGPQEAIIADGRAVLAEIEPGDREGRQVERAENVLQGKHYDK